MSLGTFLHALRPVQSWRAICAALALACVLLLDPAAALAQTRSVATTTGTAQAVILAPATLLSTQNMSFGKIAPTTTGGTVTVDPVTGACTTSQIVEMGTCRNAQFAGMGTKNGNVRLTLITNTDLTGPGQTMVFDSIVLGFNSSITFTGNANGNGKGAGLNKGGNIRYSINTASGIFNLNFGGTLHVNPNQAPGVYTGTITISVQYQ